MTETEKLDIIDSILDVLMEHSTDVRSLPEADIENGTSLPVVQGNRLVCLRLGGLLSRISRLEQQCGEAASNALRAASGYAAAKERLTGNILQSNSAVTAVNRVLARLADGDGYVYVKGEKGNDGRSAYDMLVEAAVYSGSEEDFITRLSELLYGESIDDVALWEKLGTPSLSTTLEQIDKSHLAGINFGGGIVYAEKYSADFETALNAAIAASVSEGNSYTTIDCTAFTGAHTFQNAININKPVTILLGNCTITSNGANVFNIQSNNVRIIGQNRETDRTDLTANATIIHCTYISNTSNTGYHIYSRGNKNCQYKNLTLIGARTTLGRQCDNASYPINGCGGIYIEKANPGTTSSGNTVNATIIENILLDGSKAHGIYIDTPILSTIRSCRLSNIAGHGIFITGGTTLSLDSVYVASAQLAGFCIQGVTYCTILNSVSEYSGMGWWIRSSFNVTIFSAGVEHTYNCGKNLWSSSYSVTNRYGFNLTTTNSSGATVRINDVPNDSITLRGQNVHYRDMFIGNAFLITGGRNIDMFSPYATSIGMPIGSNPDNVYDTLRYMIVTGSASAINVSNIGLKGGSSTEQSHAELVGRIIPYEIETGGNVDGLQITFNPNNTTLIGVSTTDPITSNIANRAQILNLCSNALIRYGNIYYTLIKMNGGLKIDGDFNVSGNLSVDGQISTETGIVYKGYLTHDTSSSIVVSVAYSPNESEIQWDDNGVDMTITPSVTLDGIDVTSHTTFDLYVNDSKYGTYSSSQIPITFKILSSGDYEFYVVAHYEKDGLSKVATSSTHSVEYKESQVIQPTFKEIENITYADKSYTTIFSVISSFDITSGGAAHSPSNTSPTINQNNAVSSSIEQDNQDPTIYHITVTCNRSSASQTRYVRFYYATSDASALSTERQYSDTYVVQGSNINPYNNE